MTSYIITRTDFWYLQEDCGRCRAQARYSQKNPLAHSQFAIHRLAVQPPVPMK